MDLAHGGQQFEHTSTCMPWSVNTAHSSRRYMRPPKNTPHAAKEPRMHSNTGLNRKNSLLSHHNSRLSCYTACPPCLTHGPWPKSPSTWTSQWVSKMGRLFFADEYVQRPGANSERRPCWPWAGHRVFLMATTPPLLHATKKLLVQRALSRSQGRRVAR